MRRYRIAWLVLAACLAVAAILWNLATSEVLRSGRLTGHGFATYEYSETRLDPFLAISAALVAIVGVCAWAILLRRAGWRWRGKRLTTVVIVLVMAAAATAAFFFLRDREPYRASEHYRSIDRIVTALEREGVNCQNLKRTDREAGPWRASATCDIRSEFGVPDGFDDVTIHIWSDEDARRRWLGDPTNEEIDSVAGAGWLVTCEFLPTCSDVRQALGGQLNVEY